MDNATKHEDALLVATCESCAVIQVRGRGSFKSGPALKSYCLDMMDKGYAWIVLDMIHCTGMDSTFMGVLAGIALRLKEKSRGEIVMINLTDRHAELLQTLGLDRLIKAGTGALPGGALEQISRLSDTSRLHTGGADRKTSVETMLTAHEDLVKVHPDNHGEFENVLTYLRKEMDKNATSVD